MAASSGPREPSDLDRSDSPQKDSNGGPFAANLVGGENSPIALSGDRSAGGGYSKFVSMMKIVLPFIALALVGLVVVWPRLKPDSTFSIGFSSIQLSGEAQPGMDNARYVGTDSNRQPYSVTADVARIISEANSLVALELPKADLTLDDGTWLVLTAKTGRYDGDKATLALDGDVNLFHDTGYEISTQKLMVYLNQGLAESDVPLNGHGPFGAINAQGLKLIDKGRLIHFAGPAQLTLYAPQDGGSQNK